MSILSIRKTKIVATIGPASDRVESLEAMIRAGMSVARLNLSHGSYQEHKQRIARIRQASENLQIPVAIMIDTRGVEIRTGQLQQGVVDGAENNPPSFHLSRHYEVCKFYSLDEHTGVPDVLLVSTVIWNDLTAEEQEWLTEAATESAQYQKVLWQQATEEALRVVQDAGVQILRPDKKPFADLLVTMNEEYQDDPTVASLIERIRAAAQAPDTLQ